jgi:hypothetical protein
MPRRGSGPRNRERLIVFARLFHAEAEEQRARVARAGSDVGRRGTKEDLPWIRLRGDDQGILASVVRAEVTAHESREELLAEISGVESDDRVARETQGKGKGRTRSGRGGGFEIGDRAHEGQILVVQEVRGAPAARAEKGERDGPRPRESRGPPFGQGLGGFADPLVCGLEGRGPRLWLELRDLRVEAPELPRGRVGQPHVLDQAGVRGVRPPAGAPLDEPSGVQSLRAGRVELQAKEGPRDLAIEVPCELFRAILGRGPQAGLVGLADLPEPSVLERGQHAQEHDHGAHSEDQGAGEREARRPQHFLRV